jgi:hypothetical protein
MGGLQIMIILGKKIQLFHRHSRLTPIDTLLEVRSCSGPLSP